MIDDLERNWDLLYAEARRLCHQLESREASLRKELADIELKKSKLIDFLQKLTIEDSQQITVLDADDSNEKLLNAANESYLDKIARENYDQYLIEQIGDLLSVVNLASVDYLAKKLKEPNSQIERILALEQDVLWLETSRGKWKAIRGQTLPDPAPRSEPIRSSHGLEETSSPATSTLEFTHRGLPINDKIQRGTALNKVIMLELEAVYPKCLTSKEVFDAIYSEDFRSQITSELELKIKSKIRQSLQNGVQRGKIERGGSKGEYKAKVA